MNLIKYKKILLTVSKAACLVLGLLFSSLSLAFSVYFTLARGDEFLNGYLAARVPSGETYSVAIMLLGLAVTGAVTSLFGNKRLLSYIFVTINALLCLAATILFKCWLPEISPIKWAVVLATVFVLFSAVQVTLAISEKE